MFFTKFPRYIGSQAQLYLSQLIYYCLYEYEETEAAALA